MSNPEIVRAYLRSRGWRYSGLTQQPHQVITWWRKSGREFPQHFALWLEQSGAVRLIARSQDAGAGAPRGV